MGSVSSSVGSTWEAREVASGQGQCRPQPCTHRHLALRVLCGAPSDPGWHSHSPPQPFPGPGALPPEAQAGGSQVHTQQGAGTPRAAGGALTKWKYFSVSKSFTVRKKNTINKQARGAGGLKQKCRQKDGAEWREPGTCGENKAQRKTQSQS